MINIKKYFLTLDLEEWYHLEYLKELKDEIASTQRFAPHVLPFLKKMADDGVYFTVFVLEDVARENADIIRQLAQMGHEISCHGMGHELVYKLSAEEFREKTKEAKLVIDSIVGEPIRGYRAPCFSMQDEKLDVLWDLGFTYDASLIRFKEHKLYNVMDMHSFENIESMVYKKGDKYEFETPTLDVLGKSIPISGGGYFRMFPLCLMKYFMRKHWEKQDNFIFYIHPFEVAGDTLENGKKMGWENYFRFQVGRPTLQKKLLKYIKWLKKQDVEFLTFKEYIEHNTKTNSKEGILK